VSAEKVDMLGFVLEIAGQYSHFHRKYTDVSGAS
jgi:hypothetical protein